VEAEVLILVVELVDMLTKALATFHAVALES
jgi:hypothetical protein